jgi:GST-like protein
MSDYTPPEVWTWQPKSDGNPFERQRPVSGPTHERALQVGQHPLQLYSAGTPNGHKITTLLEELLAAGESGAEYDAWLVNILAGEQFGSGFTALNPNSRIPALVDRSVPAAPIALFESGAILVYLAERFGRFLPTTGAARATTLSWLFWQVGSAPYLGGGFGHFYAYAPQKLEYPIDRYTLEVKRQLDVLNRHLADHEWLAGAELTIADFATAPWYGTLALGKLYDAGAFLAVHEYEHVVRWATQFMSRPAVKRGLRVNRAGRTGVIERHSAADLD